MDQNSCSVGGGEAPPSAKMLGYLVPWVRTFNCVSKRIFSQLDGLPVERFRGRSFREDTQ